MRKITEFERTTRKGEHRRAVVYYHVDWEEYFTRFYSNTNYVLCSTKPHHSLGEAVETADHWVNWERV